MSANRILRYPGSLGLATLVASALFVLAAGTGAAANPPVTIGSSSSSLALQHPAQDKIAYLHDGSLLIGYFDGNQAVVDQVRNPGSGSSTVQRALTISGDEVTLYTQQGASSTDIWIQVGAELVGSAPLEQVQHERRSHVVREVGDQPPPLGAEQRAQVERAGVALHDRNPMGLHHLAQHLDEVAVDLDGRDRGAGLGQRQGE